MFDSINCDYDRIACPNGHRLRSLQTKDFNCVCGGIIIVGDRIASVYEGPLGTAPTSMPVTDVVDAYEECHECPVLLTRNRTRDGCESLAIHTLWCEFTLTIVDNVLVEVKRISESFDEWLASVSTAPNLVGCEGPMTAAEANAIMESESGLPATD